VDQIKTEDSLWLKYKASHEVLILKAKNLKVRKQAAQKCLQVSTHIHFKNRSVCLLIQIQPINA